MCCYSSNTGAPRPPKQGKGVNGLEEERRLALAWSSRSAPSVQVRQAGRSTCTCANRTAQRACQVRREVEFFFVTEFFFDPTVKIQFFRTATDARGDVRCSDSGVRRGLGGPGLSLLIPSPFQRPLGASSRAQRGSLELSFTPGWHWRLRRTLARLGGESSSALGLN